MTYTISDIARIVGSTAVIVQDTVVDQLLLDSRKVHAPSNALFFAIKGPRRDGHQFVAELYKKGVRNFVVSEQAEWSVYHEANFLPVVNVLDALQELAAYHRNRFSIPVIGITGSNGKTIVKEWLYQLLQNDYHIVRSPKSYNSQIGVPLSIWQMNEQHTLAIFEAGISQPGEMHRLEKMIQPGIGVFTSIGEAHGEGFTSLEEKIQEKLLLFNGPAVRVIYPAKYASITSASQAFPFTSFTWGESTSSQLQVVAIVPHNFHTSITVRFNDNEFSFTIPFADTASVENAISCCAVMLLLGIAASVIIERMPRLQSVNMRLELKKGINQCLLINDSYSADLSSLEMALHFLAQQTSRGPKTVILSDLLQTAMPDSVLYPSIIDRLKKYQVNRVIGIGEKISKELESLVINADKNLSVELYPSTENFLQQFLSSQFREETILVKGARIFEFERIVQLLEQKAHQTVLEINLNSIGNNLRKYQQLLKPSTRVMAMVKAFAYGSGGAEIAGILQYHKVDYLGVAYADEGVELRRAGISLPVMVMNPEESSFESIVDNNLEPEIYSFDMLSALDTFLKNEGLQHYPVHIEIETGMNRLGFDVNDMKKLGTLINATNTIKVQTVFSHLAASEEPALDEFTQDQYHRFTLAADELQHVIGYSFIRHISNSAAILRHPILQLDMVRLGIGLYGVDSASTQRLTLEAAATLKSTVAQLKHLHAGESVSYNRKGMVTRDSIIATVRIGYADGYPRRLGYGIGKMLIHGQLAPVIGTVCMDMTMIDVTDIPGVEEGDDVIVFGAALPVQQLAAWAETIPYEIMTGISQRVKRIYFEE